jgi:hypothetical protein
VLEVDEGPVRPQPLAQRLAADDIARLLEQGDEYAERLFLERDAEAALAELSIADLQLERGEPDDARDRG